MSHPYTIQKNIQSLISKELQLQMCYRRTLWASHRTRSRRYSQRYRTASTHYREHLSFIHLRLLANAVDVKAFEALD